MNWVGLLSTIIIGSFSLIFLNLGIYGLKNKRFNPAGFKGILTLGTGFMWTTYASILKHLGSYDGKQAIAPSLVSIFFGSIFPLAIISTLLNYYFDIPNAIIYVFALFAIILIFLIFYATHTFKE